MTKEEFRIHCMNYFDEVLKKKKGPFLFFRMTRPKPKKRNMHHGVRMEDYCLFTDDWCEKHRMDKPRKPDSFAITSSFITTGGPQDIIEILYKFIRRNY